MRNFLFVIMLLVYGIAHCNVYEITYTTTEDQITINKATIKIQNDSNLTKILILKGDNVLFNISGISSSGIIHITPNGNIEQGCFYKYLGKLRGSLFVKTQFNNFALIIRESN